MRSKPSARWSPDLVLAVRGASAITLLAAVLVLGGALAAGHRHRVYDAVVLKTLGATRGRLIGAYALEYLLLGSATALFGVAAGSVAAWLVVTRGDEPVASYGYRAGTRCAHLASLSHDGPSGCRHLFCAGP